MHIYKYVQSHCFSSATCFVQSYDDDGDEDDDDNNNNNNNLVQSSFHSVAGVLTLIQTKI
jgi:hypothetical protein